MNGSIPIPFAIGEEVWAVGPNSRTETVTCPECLGTKILTVTQANGAQFTIGCACCTSGFGPPQGIIERTIMGRRPTRITLWQVRVDGNVISYSNSDPGATFYRTFNVEDLFTDEAACAARCKEMDERDVAYRKTQAVNHLTSKWRSLAYSVHYWQDEAKRLEENLDRARARLGLCKEREAKKKAKKSAAV